eukprot:scaffold399892_cov16-Prasinocladus_malaysianus.AAC.1
MSRDPALCLRLQLYTACQFSPSDFTCRQLPCYSPSAANVNLLHDSISAMPLQSLSCVLEAKHTTLVHQDI